MTLAIKYNIDRNKIEITSSLIENSKVALRFGWLIFKKLTGLDL